MMKPAGIKPGHDMRAFLSKDFWNFFFLAKLDTADSFSFNYRYVRLVFQLTWWIGLIALVGFCADQSGSALLGALCFVLEWVWAYLVAWAVIGAAERFCFTFLSPADRPASYTFNVLGILSLVCAFLASRHLVGLVQFAIAQPVHR